MTYFRGAYLCESPSCCHSHCCPGSGCLPRWVEWDRLSISCTAPRACPPYPRPDSRDWPLRTLGHSSDPYLPRSGTIKIQNQRLIFFIKKYMQLFRKTKFMQILLFSFFYQVQIILLKVSWYFFLSYIYIENTEVLQL